MFSCCWSSPFRVDFQKWFSWKESGGVVLSWRIVPLCSPTRWEKLFLVTSPAHVYIHVFRCPSIYVLSICSKGFLVWQVRTGISVSLQPLLVSLWVWTFYIHFYNIFILCVIFIFNFGFIYFFMIFINFLVNYLFMSFPHCSFGLPVFCLIIVKKSVRLGN